MIPNGDTNAASPACGVIVNNYIMDPGYYSGFQQEQGYADFIATGSGADLFAYNPCSTALSYNPTGSGTLTWNNGPYLLGSPTGSYVPNSALNLLVLNGSSGGATALCPSGIISGIQMICDSTITLPYLTYLYQSSPCNYQFSFTFNCALANSTSYVRYLYYSSGESISSHYSLNSFLTCL